MVIQYIISYEDNGYQQFQMVVDCEYFWRKLNNKGYLDYTDIMNMETYRYNGEHSCWIALNYHFKLNKW